VLELDSIEPAKLFGLVQVQLVVKFLRDPQSFGLLRAQDPAVDVKDHRESPGVIMVFPHL
jgi:hypothetical protein